MKSIKKILQIIQDDVIGTENRYMAMAWFACLSGLLALGMYLSSESMSFLGVADSRELQVNFEYPVEIKRIHVIPGQNVKKGDLLVELDQSELNGQIRLIRAQISKLEAERGVRRALNRIVSNASDLRTSDPLSVEIDDLTEELGYLENQRKNLYVFAEVDGIIGGVNFKKGEKVPAFTGLVSLSPQNPSYVEGFLHESLPTKVEIGRKVTVTPVSSGTPPVEGTVVSVGSRIILMPIRLSHFPNLQVWGREVVVEIPPRNGFLLGEKVQIKPHLELWSRLTRDIWPIDKAFAKERAASDEKRISLEELAPRAMTTSAELGKRFHLEPSGAIYLSDLKKFLVVSDDTDKKKSASLFLVEAEGTVLDEVLVVPGVGKVSDLESVSQQGDWIYLMTSQGLNKKGKDKGARNQFIRVKRSGLSLSDSQSVEFKPLLMKAIAASADRKLQAAFRTLKSPGDFEIESHFVDGSDLYLGFKNPMSADHQSLILVIH
ncbi:MAG TPA: biotin/lipoyl-binding protein, partial [Pseudobdellovibrionaceae bacterium]|nr:biotin/lipoyl-binding protein [Pseudobdellovibrionaceae bacterium]